MQQYYLAIDIGASSGRHILGSVQDGKIVLEEIHRFPNGMSEKNGHRCWDVDKLFQEILTGMKKCKELGKIPVSVGIDTWAVDFVLLNEKDERIGDAVGYRDSRTEGMDEEVYRIIPEEELYGRTGIQKQIFNTIYQLMAVKKQSPEQLEQAKTFLMIPDYFHFLLSGVKAVEYTNASTTQLVSPDTFDWDKELMERLGYPTDIFPEIVKPGTVLGDLTEEIATQVGYSCKVVAPATHDTGSAVLAVPASDSDFLYISSGTWSLMGVERRSADCSHKSKVRNFTNEGGYERRFRYLKNIMGLWMIQSVKKELNDQYSFAELCDLAAKADFSSRVDVNDASFLAPENMIVAVQEMCRKTGQAVPETPGEIASCIYQSLADSYCETVQEIEEMSGRTYSRIHIVGGGSNAVYLNELTAKATGKEVYAGPGEATAIGNLAAQMLQDGVYSSVEEVRTAIGVSFDMKKY
ncbi:MAG: rhamnulokinase [Lachnospiraceae bacterium]|nr:rhamnulokinase [Cuneatibacter sp.]MDD6456366.1 rhamnulokinase [Lachnospiraceae bacterium]